MKAKSQWMLGLLFAFSAVWANEQVVDVPYEKFILDNGLTVLVHEDRKAPIVAVNVWYHVGSKDEKPGKSGFAHLFEHLMFNGSENYDDEYFKPFELVGATGMNGTTNNDRTNYFANVPTTALDMALWMESDRMGHLLGAITDDKLNEQRGVVQNEKRQGENQPYGKWFEIASKLAFPGGHPYSWSVIGSMEDLNRATLEDVHEWFKEYYGPSNTVVVLAGDIDLATAKKKMNQFFGHIPGGKPLAKPKAWIAKRSGEIREVIYDRVPQSRLYMLWNVSQYGTYDADMLDVASSILGGGKNSRLYKRLVQNDQLASNVYTFNFSRELSGWFAIVAEVLPGNDSKKVEMIINEELDRFLRKGITSDELELAQASSRNGFVRGVERIGGFGGKSDLLAQNYVFTGDPTYFKKVQKNIASAKARDVEAVASKWLSDGKLVIEYHPFPELKNSSLDVARKNGPPMPQNMPELKFPDIQHAKLDNGMPVVFARRSEAPIIDFQMVFDAGYAADKGSKLGASSFAMSMLDEGTTNRNALEIEKDLELLGAQFNSYSDLDASHIVFSLLKNKMDDSLELFGDLVMNPSFSETDVNRLRTRWLAAIQQEKNRPNQQALRILPPLLYGDDHAYSVPFTGSGTEQSILSLSPEDLRQFYTNWIRPDNATLVVAGDTTLEEIVPKLNKMFKRWSAPKQAIPTKNIAKVDRPKQSIVYLVDKKEAVQSMIIAGHLAPEYSADNRLALQTANTILGGSFTSRLNMNLREDKSWSYGASTVYSSAKGQRPFFAYAPVQTDKTVESIAEIQNEMINFLAEKPATQEELEKVIADNTRSLPGEYETLSSVRRELANNVKYGRDDNYIYQYKSEMEAMTTEKVKQATTDLIHPEALTWVIVGDLEKIELKVRDLRLGEVIILDENGKKLR